MRSGWVLVTALCATMLVTGFSHPAQAQAQAQEQDGPSIIASAWSGLTAGLFVGAGGGYLVGRRDGWKKSDWRAVGLGMGIGALAGAGLGLTLGFVDKAGAPGGRYIARDLSAGAGFGAVIGVISGGISAAIQSKPEHLLFGTAIGVCAGAGLGIITGIVEGIAKRNHTTTATSGLHLEPSLVMTRVIDNSNVVLPGINGRF